MADAADWLRHAVASGAIQVAKLESEIERLRLTDAEREAIAACVADDEAATAYGRADTLRGLLHRHAGSGASHE
jgi:hypothetical protein